jgi:hypothetical protein
MQERFTIVSPSGTRHIIGIPPVRKSAAAHATIRVTTICGFSVRPEDALTEATRECGFCKRELIEEFALAAESGRGFTMLKDIIREAQQRGEVRRGDPSLLARVALALVLGASFDSEDPYFVCVSNEVLRSGLNGHGPSEQT